MSKTPSPIEQAIKSYLDERAKTDELFAKSYAKPGKNIDECFAYVWGEAYKRSVSTSVPGFNGKGADIPNEEVFGMAVHYYDEDDIKVNKMPANIKTSVSRPSASMELTEEDKEKARQAALKRLEEEQHALLKKKAVRPKKESTEVQQMSLF